MMKHDIQDIKQENWRFFGVHAVAYMRSMPDGIGIFAADGVMLDVAQTAEEAKHALAARRLQLMALH